MMTEDKNMKRKVNAAGLQQIALRPMLHEAVSDLKMSNRQHRKKQSNQGA